MKIQNLLFALFVCAVSVFPLAAQQTAPSPDAPRDAKPIEINEDFDLNIVSDRITETDFERSTAARVTGENSVSVRVGASVRAGQIDVILRGIYGRVRFRASLAEIQKRLERLQNAPRPSQTAPQ